MAPYAAPNGTKETTWYMNGELCSALYSFPIQPKTREQQQFILQEFRNSQYKWAIDFDIGIYVGLQGMEAYWAWLDNSTFEGTWCPGVNPDVTDPTKAPVCAVMKFLDSSNPASVDACFCPVHCEKKGTYTTLSNVPRNTTATKLVSIRLGGDSERVARGAQLLLHFK